jgi:hypothetical protein
MYDDHGHRLGWICFFNKLSRGASDWPVGGVRRSTRLSGGVWAVPLHVRRVCLRALVVVAIGTMASAEDSGNATFMHFVDPFFGKRNAVRTHIL